MVRQVVLHIGIHKTGTSSIQASLAGFDDGTRFYADFDEANHSLPLFTAFSRSFETYHIWQKRGLTRQQIRKRRGAYLDRLEANLTRDGREVLILSGEDVGFLHRDDKAALVKALTRHGATVQVICYVRAPASYAASITQQNIRGGGKALPAKAAPAYVHRLRPFVEKLPSGAVTVRDFSRSGLVGGSVVTDFCALCGIDPSRITETTTNESLSAPALKLIYAFNTSNPCFFGDEMVFSARQALVQAIAGAYADAEKIETARFRCIADTSETSWLHDTFGIDFTDDAATNGGEIADLEAWLRDLSDVDITPLKEVLDSHGIAGRFDTAQAMLSRLYYQLMHKALARLSPSTLRRADAEVLRDAALTIEADRALTREEASALMALAARARPNGPLIRRKLAEWTEKE